MKIKQQVKRAKSRYTNGADEFGIVIGVRYVPEKHFIISNLWTLAKAVKLYSVPEYFVLFQNPNNGRFFEEWCKEADLVVAKSTTGETK